MKFEIIDKMTNKRANLKEYVKNRKDLYDAKFINVYMCSDGSFYLETVIPDKYEPAFQEHKLDTDLFEVKWIEDK